MTQHAAQRIGCHTVKSLTQAAGWVPGCGRMQLIQKGPSAAQCGHPFRDYLGVHVRHAYRFDDDTGQFGKALAMSSARANGHGSPSRWPPIHTAGFRQQRGRAGRDPGTAASSRDE
jgi:hypothetical protein